MRFTRVVRLCVLHVLPSHGSMTRHALPSAGSRRCGSPDSQVIRRAPTPRRPSRRTSFPSLGGTTAAPSCSSPTAPGAGPRIIPELVSRAPAGLCRWRRRGLPSSRGTLMIIRPVLRPRRDRTGPLGPRVDLPDRAPAPDNNEGSPRGLISGLNRTAFDLAVYASRGQLPARHARLASGRWPSFAGRDWLPTGFRRKVSSVRCPPLPSFLAQCQTRPRRVLQRKGLENLLPPMLT